MSDGPERHVWERAFSAWDDAPTNPSRIGDADQAAAAVIRSYGDQRDAEAYQRGKIEGARLAIEAALENTDPCCGKCGDNIAALSPTMIVGEG